ncbi:MAG: MFS transporter [Bacteroidales bacterium]|nr:MFS transporter [Bacteroidales bacterium]
METNKLRYSHLLPVLMSFFVMSFVDLVGIGVDRVSKDMDLNATMGQLIPSAAFLWFLLLSVPTGIIQARIGKRHMLNIGMGITALGMLLPFFVYSFETVLAGFALLGIGNTIVQVSANPLLVDVVPGNRVSSFMSFSQFIKAIGSMIGAPLAALFAIQFGDWKLIFLVFGIVSILSVLWLGAVKIDERVVEGQKVTFATAFKLLGNSFIFLMVLSIFVVVGVDVGFNSNSGQFLIKHFGMEEVAAESGRSVYFFGRMLGTFLGAILLTRLSPRKFFVWTSILGIIALLIILFSHAHFMAWILVFIIGLAVANIWPLVFSITVEKYPTRTNEISGLMMMAICGGAVIPLLMGWVTDLSSAAAGIWVLIGCMVYLLGVAVYSLRR